MRILSLIHLFFFFNDTATTEIYTLSLHDALPISSVSPRRTSFTPRPPCARAPTLPDRKSTRLNSSHSQISYAVFCLKKKKNQISHTFSIFTHYTTIQSHVHHYACAHTRQHAAVYT